MRKSTSLSFGALALAAIVAAGCSGSGYTAASSSTSTPIPVPTGSCSPPAGETIQQVFPQNHSTAAPNLQGVVFAVAPNPLPTNWYFYVEHKDPNSGAILTTLGTAQIGFLMTPSPQPTLNPSPGPTPTSLVTGTPLPTPSDPATGAAFPAAPATPLYEVASIGNFANSTSFSVFLANTTCGTGIPMSSFTTAPTDLPTPTPVPSAT